MIRLFELPVNEEALDGLVRDMRTMGFKATEARPLVEKAGALAIATLRGLDEPILKMTEDEVERTMIQQIVFSYLTETMRKMMKANADRQFIEILRHMLGDRK